jgi:lycopene cyclase domain-containing protein
MEHYTYLLVTLLSVSVPFLAGFHPLLKFYREWKYLFPAMFITLAFFITWDMLFTNLGVWGFNPKYVTGFYVFNLPVEEWLFFITIPYASIFTYHALNILLKFKIPLKVTNYVSYCLVAILLAIGVFSFPRLYTSVTFLLTAVFIFIHTVSIRQQYLGRFYFSYLVVLIPFFIVNGILTGSFIHHEVVWYNSDQILNIRMLTIPVEDSIYGLLLLMMNITLYEHFKSNGKISFGYKV